MPLLSFTPYSILLLGSVHFKNTSSEVYNFSQEDKISYDFSV